MDFSYSEEQQALRELARRLFAERFTDDFRKSFARSGQPFDPVLWAALAEAGILGTAIEATQGGSGLGLTELALVLQEQGRTLAAVPLFATLVLGALPLQRFGNPGQRRLLGAVAAGELLLSAALEEPGNALLLEPATVAEPLGGGWRITGVKTCVPYALQAQYLLVSARTPAGSRLFLLERHAPGLELTAQHSTSGEPQAQVQLRDVPAGEGDALGEDARALHFLLEHAQVALAALQLGVVGEALRRGAAYASARQQFGRPIGSFQAVQHRLADCYIDLEALRSVYLRAVWALDQGLSAGAEVLAAKWWAAQAGHRVSHAVQHVHGGLGADVEYPVQAFFLQAKQLEIALGGATPVLAGIGQALVAGSVDSFTGLRGSNGRDQL
jgi:alkylation response protein AidB-like acyl-CoA dehydrogenase